MDRQPWTWYFAMIYIMHINYIINIKSHIELQQCDVMNPNEKSRGTFVLQNVLVDSAFCTILMYMCDTLHQIAEVSLFTS